MTHPAEAAGIAERLTALPARLIDHLAVISDCGRYRYWLQRPLNLWGEGKRVCFVMLNPSTADASTDDPTIRRCMAFAKAAGGDRMLVVNLFALRSPSPDDLLKGDDPVGPANSDAIEYALKASDLVIAAWGARRERPSWFANLMRDQIASVKDAAERAGRPLHCLALTAQGDPRHPLYLPKASAPMQWPPADGLAVAHILREQEKTKCS